MKRFFLPLFLVITLVLSPCAAALTTPSPLEAFFPDSLVQGSVPAQSDPVESMQPALHALVLTMVENHLPYQPEDPTFLWTSLYYMLSLYGAWDTRAQLTDDTLILPSEILSDYAAALYPSVQPLPPVPSPISHRISYDPDTDSYRLARGDAGLDALHITQTRTLAQGQQQILGELRFLEDNRTLVKFEATLSLCDTMFGYVITHLSLSTPV